MSVKGGCFIVKGGCFIVKGDCFIVISYYRHGLRGIGNRMSEVGLKNGGVVKCTIEVGQKIRPVMEAI